MLITMKKLCILFVLAIISYKCAAQTTLPELKNINYYTVASAYWIEQFSLNGDSLLIEQRRDGNIKDAAHYHIEYAKNRGDYFVIAVKVDPVGKISGFTGGIRYTVLMVISFSKDKKKLFLMQRGFRYKSIEEAQRGVDTIRLDNKYYTTWYTKSVLDKYLQYPKVQDADEAVVHKVMDDWFAEMTTNQDKIRNTLNIPFQNSLNLALIKNNLSPLVTAAEFQQSLNKYHIKVPVLPVRPQVVPKVKPNSQPGVRIDEPIKN